MTEVEGLCNILLPFFFFHKTHVCLNSQITSNHAQSPDQIPSRTDQPWNTCKMSATVLNLHWGYSSIAGILKKLWLPCSPQWNQRDWQDAVSRSITVNGVPQRKVSLTPYTLSENLCVASPFIRHSPWEPILWKVKMHKQRVQVSGLSQTLTLYENWDENHGFFLMTRDSVCSSRTWTQWGLGARLRIA